MSAPVRIVVIGPESSGKTTLAQQLGAWLQAPVIPEYAREYAEQVGRPLTADDVEPIARGQVAAEDHPRAELVATAHLVPRATPGPGPRAPDSEPGEIILDTDLVSTTVYAEHYYGHVPPWVMDAARERLGALYLLTAPDLPWEADGIRDQPHGRHLLHQAFARRLAELGACVVGVSGVGAQRLEAAMAVVRGWRAAHPSAGAAVSPPGAGARVTR